MRPFGQEGLGGQDAVPAAAAAAREAGLREAARIAARADELQALRELGTLEQTEPRDEVVRDELTRRAGGYVRPTSTPGSPTPWPRTSGTTAPRPHARQRPAFSPRRSSRTPRCSPNSPAWSPAPTSQLAFAARLATTERAAAGALAVFLARVRS
ncbi:hypothetical protein OIE43_43000 [Streptomyces pseudovenezuelae]|nr:hypothetical protein [Streptomyces pseudovenezuelae]